MAKWQDICSYVLLIPHDHTKRSWNFLGATISNDEAEGSWDHTSKVTNCFP